jgi:uncharacterized protein
VTAHAPQSPAGDAAAVIAALGLDTHPEGGFFRETYRSLDTVETERGPRCAATAIAFLLTPAAPSRFHRLASDELWFWQGGASLELLLLSAGRPTVERILLGPVGGAARRMARVPARTWQAARVVSSDAVSGDTWSLVSCVVVPGFEYADFTLAEARTLTEDFPAEADLIVALT